MSERNYLFSKFDLGETLRNMESGMLREIDSIEGNKLLNTKIDDWIEYFIDKYNIKHLTLREESISTDQSETQVDVRYDNSRLIRDRSQPFYINGTKICFYIPFDGDEKLFYMQPSTRTMNPPMADIENNELAIVFNKINPNPDSVKNEFNQILSSIKQNIGWQEKEILEFNNSLSGKVKAKIEARREKLIADQSIVSLLGFPLKKRTNSLKTYSVPEVKRKIISQPQPESEEPFVPEPVLDKKEYDNILKIISDMAFVLERSPKAFSSMQEEDIRNHFLVQLNGQYEGQATGETFNNEGKTDILIRSEGKNIFIAECKFWKGPKSIENAIDQLLGYASWRDTKTAIIVFNRTKNFSAVIDKIPEIFKEHPNFVSVNKFDGETCFQYIFHHKDDINRKIIITVLLFEVPE